MEGILLAAAVIFLLLDLPEKIEKACKLWLAIKRKYREFRAWLRRKVGR